MTAELTALLIEITSIGLAGKQLKKPIELPRPSDQKKKQAVRSGDTTPTRDATDAAFKQGISVLAATTKAVGR